MSTRTAKDDSVFHQNRYASAPEFERGLIANLVAKRCEILDDKADRELIWFIQYLSHQPGGMAAVAAELLARFPDRLGTASMVKSRKKIYQSEETEKIRLEFPRALRLRFPLRGETKDDFLRLYNSQAARLRRSAEMSRYLQSFADNALRRADMVEEGRAAELADADAQELKKALNHPATYPASAMLDLCREAAVNGFDNENDTDNLETELSKLCLDPAWNLTAGGPWYFSDLVNVLREFHQQWIEENSGVVVTALGQKVCAALDYTLYGHTLALLEGDARLGKSFAARAWCLQHPGQSRFVEVPTGNDDTSFFRALARGLGLGNFLKYKTIDIRERVESVLLPGDLLLVLDEAHRLWPEQNSRYAYPKRITWVMAMVNAGVPICLVSTPQFIQSQKAAEKNGWNSAQLTGRIGHYEFLPTKLSEPDIIAVARAVLPEASENVLLALADYAGQSARYLAAVDSISKRARYLAQLKGRAECNSSDVHAAMKESVVPSDRMLVHTLEQARKTSGSGRKPLPAPAEIQVETPARGSRPAAMEFSRRGEALPELVEG